jgi:WD40 repeat protein
MLSADHVPVGAKVGCKKCRAVFPLEIGFGEAGPGRGSSASRPASAPSASEDILYIGEAPTEAERRVADARRRGGAVPAGAAVVSTPPAPPPARRASGRPLTRPPGALRGMILLGCLVGAVTAAWVWTKAVRFRGCKLGGGCPSSSWRATCGTTGGDFGGCPSVSAYNPDRAGGLTAMPTLPTPAADPAREPRVLTGHVGDVLAAAFSPDGRLATGGADNVIRLWGPVGSPFAVTLTGAGDRVRSGAPVAILAGHEGSVRGVAFSPDGLTLASVAYDASLRLWNAFDGSVRGVAAIDGATGLNAVAFSPDGKTVAVAGSSGVRLVSVADLTRRTALAGTRGSVHAVAFSPDGKTLAAACEDRTVRLWDASTGRETGTLTGAAAGLMSVAFSADGRTIAAGDRDGAVRTWDVATGRETAVLRGHEGAVRGVAFAGETPVSVGLDKTLRGWDLSAGRESFKIAAHGREVMALAATGDGATLATGGYDRNVKVWTVDALRRSAAPAAPTAPSAPAATAPSAPAESPDATEAEKLIEGLDR